MIRDGTVESEQPSGDSRTDPAQAQDPDLQPADIPRVGELPVERPPTRPYVAVGRAKTPQRHQDQPQRRIGNGVRQHVGGVAHTDTTALGRVEIDPIHAVAVVDDRLQVGQRRDGDWRRHRGGPTSPPREIRLRARPETWPARDRREASGFRNCASSSASKVGSNVPIHSTSHRSCSPPRLHHPPDVNATWMSRQVARQPIPRHDERPAARLAPVFTGPLRALLERSAWWGDARRSLLAGNEGDPPAP